MLDLEFTFTAELWIYTDPGAWHFLTLPVDISEQIKFFRDKHYDFGTIRVKALIGKTEWKTSLFPDKTSNSFLLPIKAEVREKEGLSVGESASVKIFIDSGS